MSAGRRRPSSERDASRERGALWMICARNFPSKLGSQADFLSRRSSKESEAGLESAGEGAKPPETAQNQKQQFVKMPWRIPVLDVLGALRGSPDKPSRAPDSADPNQDEGASSYTLGEQLFFTGASRDTSNGDWLQRGLQGEVTGPATLESHIGNGVAMRFPGHQGTVDCLYSELSRDRHVTEPQSREQPADAAPIDHGTAEASSPILKGALQSMQGALQGALQSADVAAAAAIPAVPDARGSAAALAPAASAEPASAQVVMARPRYVPSNTRRTSIDDILSERAETVTKSSPVQDKGDATAKITLMLKRKNGKFGIGIRDDNYVHEVWKGGASHLAGIREGDWVSLAFGTTAARLAAPPALLHGCQRVVGEWCADCLRRRRLRYRLRAHTPAHNGTSLPLPRPRHRLPSQEPRF
eukprot:Transcript_3756.p1 GENE.Transcript_3756~~Transcript_3756.p1  ORF type:complete len:424 (-),score=23.21 Transcript_3756:322-1566(-)